MIATYAGEVKDIYNRIRLRKAEKKKFVKDFDNVGRIRMDVQNDEDRNRIRVITGKTTKR